MSPLPFVPRWKGAVEGHAINRSRVFFPQLAVDHELDDLIQEAYIVFMKCKRRYYGAESASLAPGGRRRVDSPAWFMALYSRALHNRLLNLVRRARKFDEWPISLEALGGIESAPLASSSRGQSETCFLARTIAELPVEIGDLIREAMCGPDESARAAGEALLALPRWAKERIRRALETDGMESAAGRPSLRRLLMPRPPVQLIANHI